MDEFGPLNLQPRPGRQWAAVTGKGKEPGRAPRPRMRATYTRTAGVRHLLAAYELGEDKLFGHVKPRKTRGRFLEFRRYLRSLYPLTIRIAIICDNFSPHLSTAKDTRVGEWAAANNVEITSSPGALFQRAGEPGRRGRRLSAAWVSGPGPGCAAAAVPAARSGR